MVPEPDNGSMRIDNRIGKRMAIIIELAKW